MSDGEAENGEAANARDLFAWLSREVRELVSHVPRVHSPSPIGFLRDHVSSNRPAVITGAFDDWPAMERWNLDYLADAMGDAKVSVNVTPDGRGDALLSTDGWTVSGLGDDEMKPGEVFVQPEEREMTLREFATMLATPTADLDANAHASRQSAVPYVSRQCGSLLEEFPSLVNDCADEVPFASEALGKPPDAVNLWIGDERSQTTFHRDHYENVYCVVRGVKVFHLLPPCDGRVLGVAEAPAAREAHSFGRFTDPLPFGSSSVGLDIAFPRASHAYGLPERTVAHALPPTLGKVRVRARVRIRVSLILTPIRSLTLTLLLTLTKEPYRLFNLDVFEYELDHPMSVYGAVPFLHAHGEDGRSLLLVDETNLATAGHLDAFGSVHLDRLHQIVAQGPAETLGQPSQQRTHTFCQALYQLRAVGAAQHREEIPENQRRLLRAPQRTICL